MRFTSMLFDPGAVAGVAGATGTPRNTNRVSAYTDAQIIGAMQVEDFTGEIPGKIREGGFGRSSEFLDRIRTDLLPGKAIRINVGDFMPANTDAEFKKAVQTLRSRYSRKGALDFKNEVTDRSDAKARQLILYRMPAAGANLQQGNTPAAPVAVAAAPTININPAPNQVVEGTVGGVAVRLSSHAQPATPAVAPAKVAASNKNANAKRK